MSVKISVCATTYNERKNIEKSLDSVLKINPDEIVITDNESSDDTIEKIFKYKEKTGSLKIISQKCTRGTGRNISIQHAQNEYCLVLDLDNFYIFNKINFDKLAKKAKNNLIVISDKAYRTVYFIFGKRELFLRYPYKDMNTFEDFTFFRNAPVKWYWIKNLGVDLDQERNNLKRNKITRLKNTIIAFSIYYTYGFTFKDIIDIIFKKKSLKYIGFDLIFLFTYKFINFINREILK